MPLGDMFNDPYEREVQSNYPGDEKSSSSLTDKFFSFGKNALVFMAAVHAVKGIAKLTSWAGSTVTKKLISSNSEIGSVVKEVKRYL